MGAADLHQGCELVIGDLAHEMHPRHIQPVAHLVQDCVFPAFCALGRASIAHLVAAHDHHLRLGAGFQHVGQGAHKGVIAAIRFKVAVYKGQHLVPRFHALAVGQGKAGLRVGGHGGGVHPIMDHIQHLPQRGGKGRGLPRRGCHPRIGVQHGLAQMPRSALGDHDLIKAGRVEFGVKAHIRAAPAIVELGIDQQLGLGPNLFQEQRLAPAGMAKDHVGHITALLAQVQCSAGDRDAPVAHLRVIAAQAGGCGVNRLRGVFVFQRFGGRGALVAKIGQGKAIMPKAGKFWGKVQELAGEILVNKQNFHKGFPKAAVSNAFV